MKQGVGNGGSGSLSQIVVAYVNGTHAVQEPVNTMVSRVIAKFVVTNVGNRVQIIGYF